MGQIKQGFCDRENRTEPGRLRAFGLPHSVWQARGDHPHQAEETTIR